MKTRHLLVSFALGLGLALALLWVLSGWPASVTAAPAAELHVCPSGCAYSSVQGAVDAANEGDVIKVAAGTYTDVNNYGGLAQVVYVSKTLTIRGGYTTTNGFADPADPDANPTTLDAQRQGRVLYITGGISATIEGLRITGGDSGDFCGIGISAGGGGVFADGADALIIGNIITDNVAGSFGCQGGGLFLRDTTLATLVQDNTIVGNSGGDGGGGLVMSDGHGTIKNNLISHNYAFYWAGGAELGNSDATFQGNVVANNSVMGGGYGIGLRLYGSNAIIYDNVIANNHSTIENTGGGISAQGGHPTIDHNTISNHTARRGGGIYLAGCNASLSGNVIHGNEATTHGGALCIESGSTVTLTNNIVVDNQAHTLADGITLNDSRGLLLHNTVADNHGTGVGIYGGVTTTLYLTNSIIAGHSAVGISVTDGSTATLEATLWYGNGSDTGGEGTIITGTHNYWGDPVFVYPNGGDYHIDVGSAAIDRGVGAGITVDMDGAPRDALPDLGTDEHPCIPVSDVQLSRTPSGDLFTGNTVLFAADANGTTPFTYTWTLNGAPVGENWSTFEHTFAVSDTYTVGVTVTNGCGQDSATMVVVIDDPAPQQPDLSQSYKSVNLTNVDSGDTLTCTLFLRNSSAVTATAILTDPIPAYTTYISGSAQASDGGPVTLASGALVWSGEVISGTPVVIQFAVEVQAAPVGTPITNVAYLDDGLGNVTPLEASSTYNPGYGLTINDGAQYTNIPTVTLRYSWNVADDILYVKFSNDGGFGPGGDTTAWIPVSPADPTYPDWVLDTYGGLVLPRTVYAKFRDGSGLQYGPIQDDIIYDPGPPEVTVVEIITQTGGGALSAMAGKDVIVRVTTSDDNSGVSKVQLSHSADFARYSEFAVTGGTTDISWTLQPSGQVYVRVVDRAGNLSEVESEQGPPNYEVYLPLVLRLYVTP